MSNQIFKLFDVGKRKQLIPLSSRKITRKEKIKSWSITFLSCGKMRLRVDLNFQTRDYHLFIASVQWSRWIDWDRFNGLSPIIKSCCSVLENFSFSCNTGFMLGSPVKSSVRECSISNARSRNFLDIFGPQQLRAKILSNSWQKAKPVQRAITRSYGPKEKTFTPCGMGTIIFQREI